MDEDLHRMLGLRIPENGEAAKPATISKKGKTTRRGRKRLLSRESLDGRTAIAKLFDGMVAAIHSDLGGRDQLSAIQRGFVEAFAGATVTLDHINARILAGAEIDNALVSMHASAISAMVRSASRLGVERRSRDITPSVKDYLEHVSEESCRMKPSLPLRRALADPHLLGNILAGPSGQRGAHC